MRIYAKIRKWLVSSRRGLPIVLLVAPLFLLPEDLKDRNGIYGRIARNYLHIVWSGFFFAYTYSKFSDTVLSTLNVEFPEDKLFGFISSHFAFSSANYFCTFLLSSIVIVISAALAWGVHNMSGFIIQKTGRLSNIPAFTYFTMQRSVQFCWFGVWVWFLTFVFPYLSGSKEMPELTFSTENNWMVLIPMMIFVLLNMRRDYIIKLRGVQIYPNGTVRFFVTLLSLALIVGGMYIILRLALMM